MKISIISGNSFVYSEYINKVETKDSADTKVQDSENPSFAETLQSIKDMLQKKVGESGEKDSGSESNTEASGGSTVSTDSKLFGNSGINPSVSTNSTVTNTTVPPASTGGEINVRTTDPNYQSIAPAQYQEYFKEAAATYNIDQKLLEVVAYYESNFSANEVSSAGAVGIMQLMPGTANGLGITDIYDPRDNIMCGAKLLSRLADSYDGNLDLMLAGYNAGQGAVAKYGGVPPYKETTTYIERIHSKYP